MGYGISHEFGGARSLVSVDCKTSFGGPGPMFHSFGDEEIGRYVLNRGY